MSARYTKRTVTPKMAADILSTIPDLYRNLRMSHVRNLVEQMENGEWDPGTAQFIKLTRDGRLVDGRHRLTAAQIYGKPILMEFALGISDKTQGKQDVCAPKSEADSLKLWGYSNCSIMASMMKWIKKYELHVMTPTTTQWDRLRRRLTERELKNIIDDYSQVQEAVTMGQSYHVYGMIGPSIMAFNWWGASQTNAEKATEFSVEVATGVHSYVGSPAAALRKTATAQINARVKLKPGITCHMVAKAYGMFLSGKKSKQIKIGPDEIFPLYDADR